jgi:pyruvate dehydrogenase E2 component (dihydrolipoamide acetyltransferase)
MATGSGMRAPSAQDVLIGDGRRLRVRRWEGTGRPLVLLHGLLDDSEGWARLAADTHRPCLAIDLPGFGGSDLPRTPRVAAYADDVAAGLRRLGIDDCTLVGHSLGGAVAAAVAERDAGVASLALLAPAGFGRIRLAEGLTLPVVIDVAELALPLALLNPLVCVAAYSTFVAHRRLPSPDLLGRLRRRAFHSAPGVRAATLAISHAGRAPDGFAHRRIDFSGPVAALWGEHDALVSRSHIAALRSALPQAHVEVWDGMGHHPQRERPAQLARFIELRATRARRAGRRRPAGTSRAA